MSSSRLLRETVKRSKPLQPARQAGQPCVKRAVFAGDFHCLTTGLHSNLCAWPSFDLQFHPLSQPGSLTLSSHTYFFFLFSFPFQLCEATKKCFEKPQNDVGISPFPRENKWSCPVSQVMFAPKIAHYVVCYSSPHTLPLLLRGSREPGNLAFTYVHTLY